MARELGTATFAEGEGATLTIDATNSIELVGISVDGTVPSGFFCLE